MYDIKRWLAYLVGASDCMLNDIREPQGLSEPALKVKTWRGDFMPATHNYSIHYGVTDYLSRSLWFMVILGVVVYTPIQQVSRISSN